MFNRGRAPAAFQGWSSAAIKGSSRFPSGGVMSGGSECSGSGSGSYCSGIRVRKRWRGGARRRRKNSIGSSCWYAIHRDHQISMLGDTTAPEMMMMMMIIVEGVIENWGWHARASNSVQCRLGETVGCGVKVTATAPGAAGHSKGGCLRICRRIGAVRVRRSHKR